MNEEQREKIGRIITQCWLDEEFKRRFTADPKAILRAEGIEVHIEHIEVRVVEDTSHLLHMVLPSRPAEGELSDGALEAIAAGGVHGGGFFSIGYSL